MILSEFEGFMAKHFQHNQKINESSYVVCYPSTCKLCEMQLFLLSQIGIVHNISVLFFNFHIDKILISAI